MSRLIRGVWEANLNAPSRGDRRPCAYRAYLPDPLMERTFRFDGQVAADLADAERAIAGLNLTARALIDTEALARMLLRAEAVGSSRIEGLEVGARRLLRAEAAMSAGDSGVDVTAGEVLGNIAAMAETLAQVQAGQAITLDTLTAFHRRLLVATPQAALGGVVRTQQNWIGGSNFNPCAAAFVPPPPAHVPRLLADLMEFCNGDDLPAVAQAAIAHAQFETIHPFADGNGRTGRALIHLILKRRDLAPQVQPPVSLILATWAQSYIDGLMAFRYHGASTSQQAYAGSALWVGRFAGACVRAVADVTLFERRAQAVEAHWRNTLGSIRQGSATDLLLRSLLGAPVVTVASAAKLLGRSPQQVNEAMARLVDAQIVRQVNAGRRNRAFEAPAIVAAFDSLERQLASPQGDTLSSPPSRRVPMRQK
jgi:Fic family protein